MCPIFIGQHVYITCERSKFPICQSKTRFCRSCHNMSKLFIQPNIILSNQMWFVPYRWYQRCHLSGPLHIGYLKEKDKMLILHLTQNCLSVLFPYCFHIISVSMLFMFPYYFTVNTKAPSVPYTCKYDWTVSVLISKIRTEGLRT